MNSKWPLQKKKRRRYPMTMEKDRSLNQYIYLSKIYRYEFFRRWLYLAWSSFWILKLSSADMQTAKILISSSFLQTILFKKWKYVTERMITHSLSIFVMLLQKSDKRSAEFVEKISTSLEEYFRCHESSPKDFYKEFGLDCAPGIISFLYNPPIVIISLNSPRWLLLWSVVVLRTRSGNDIFDTILCIVSWSKSLNTYEIIWKDVEVLLKDVRTPSRKWDG